MTKVTSAGLHPRTRERLQALHGLGRPFSVAEAAGVIALDPVRARRLLADLVRGGWLARVRRDLYAVVPFEASHASTWREDPLRVASKVFSPCYVGGFTALHHWELTDQVFRSIVVFTARPVRRATQLVHGTTFLVRHRPNAGKAGVLKIWLQSISVLISDPAQTLADVLDEPALGGGARHVAECLESYWRSEHLAPDKLLQAADRLGNGAVFKRLGYLLETLGLDDDALRDACRTRISKGIASLDPGAPPRGRLVTRWGLRVNAHIGKSV